MNVFNNMFANNVSAHEGGGVSLNDATSVRFFNNTVMKNIPRRPRRPATDCRYRQACRHRQQCSTASDAPVRLTGLQ